MYDLFKSRIIILSLVILFLLTLSLFLTSQTAFADHPPWDCFSQCTGNCGGCGSNAGEYVDLIWDEAAGECFHIGSDCRTQCSGPCRTCTPHTQCAPPEPGPNFCCDPTLKKPNNVCNYLQNYWYDTNCNCVESWKDISKATHDCSWDNYRCCPPPQPSCNYNREYNECNSNCNGTNYPDDHLVRVTEYTNPSGSACRYDCNDLGRIAGQCGVPGNTQLYSCSNGACVPDPAGFTTDPSCGGQCTQPPPGGQKYACSGGACVVNASGPYITNNCNNACSAPPGGCSVGWTLSNENPAPNTNIQVKVRGLSDPLGWSNIQLWMDGSSNNVGSWGGIENPWPTFVYNNVSARSPGGHTLEFRTNNGSRTCAPSKTFTTSSACTVSWSVSNPNPPANSTVEVRVSGQSSSVGWNNIGLYLDGATGDYGWGGITNPWPTFIYPSVPTRNAGSHALQFRVNNGSISCTPNGSFNTQSPPANLTITKPACSETPYPVTFNWNNTSPVLWLDIIQAGSGWGSYSQKNVSNQTSTTAPAGFNPGFTFNPGTPYLWRLGNGSSYTYGDQWSVPLCVRAWIQTIGGDVHSNVRIDMGGGP